jgi:hypothetical protein
MNSTNSVDMNSRKSVRRPPSEGYLGSDEADQLARMIFELLSELWIMRDRQLAMEELIVEKAVLTRSEIESFVPKGQASERFELIRQQLVENVLTAPYRHEVSVESLVKRGRARSKANRVR